MTDLSIIIISYNTSDITLACLKSLEESLQNIPTLKVEIIFFDNNSKDDTKKLVHGFIHGLEDSPNITIKTIFHRENIGYAQGNNLAVGYTEAPYILFLNSDTEILGNAIHKLYTFLLNHHEYHFAAPKLLNADMSAQPSCGRFYTLPVAFSALFLRGDYWGLTRFSPARTREVDWVSGACFLTRKEHFTDLGGFDEKVFMYWDEVDLFYRAHQKGLKTVFYPDAHIIHLEGASSSSRTFPILKVFQGYLYFYKKHYSLLHQNILSYMLQLKALVSYAIGRIFRNAYLTDTYSQAYEMVKKNR